MTTFADLKFKPHPMAHVAPGAIQAMHKFPNGISVSVIFIPEFSMGSKQGLFEVMASNSNDPIGYLTKDEVTEFLTMVEGPQSDSDVDMIQTSIQPRLNK